MFCWFSVHLQSLWLLLLQFHSPILISVEIQDHCVFFCCFLTSKYNAVNVLLICSALAISLAPSAPIPFAYFDISWNSRSLCVFFVVFSPPNLILSMCCWFAVHWQSLWLLLLQFYSSILISVEIQDHLRVFFVAFSPPNIILSMCCWFAVHWQSLWLLLLQFHSPILKSVEIQDHCVFFCCFLTRKSNAVNVLLICSALAISLAPSAPILFSYFEISWNSRSRLYCSMSLSHTHILIVSPSLWLRKALILFRGTPFFRTCFSFFTEKQ